jgi:hypothetical protein
MIVSKDAYYIDIAKTGSTFITKNLERICDGYTVSKFQNVTGRIHDDRHGRLVGYKKEDFKDKLIFASLRDPISIYISTWGNEDINGPHKLNFKANHPDYQDHIWEFCRRATNWHPCGTPLTAQELPRQINRPDRLGMVTFRYLDWVDDTFFTQKRTWEEVEEWYDAHYFDPAVPIHFLGPKNIGSDLANLIRNNLDKFNFKEGVRIESELRQIEQNEYMNTRYNKEMHRSIFDNINRNDPTLLDDLRDAERILYSRIDFS